MVVKEGDFERKSRLIIFSTEGGIKVNIMVKLCNSLIILEIFSEN